MTQTCAIVVNWNRKVDTLSCLSSLSAAEGIGGVIVVDNGSKDGSVVAIHQQFPTVTVLEIERNLGYAAGSNLGAAHFLKQSSCQFMLLLNNDVTIAPDAVDQLVKAMETSETIGITVPKIYYADVPDRLWYAGGGIDWKAGSCTHYGFGKRDRGQFGLQRDVSFACGAATLIRREVIEKLGLFDEHYYMFEEDVEYSIRVKRAGYTICYVPEAKAWHKVGTSAASRGEAFVWYYLIRNRLYTMCTYAHAHQWLQFLFYFPTLCVWKSVRYALWGNPQVAIGIGNGLLAYFKGHKGESLGK